MCGATAVLDETPRMLARTTAKAAPELEIKFQLGAGAVEALQGELFPAAEAKVAQLHAVYFDTPDHILRDAGFSLRVRARAGTYTQTLKHRAEGGLFERDEWENRVAGPDLDHAVLAQTPVRDVVGDATLAPAFVVEVERRTYIWTRGEARIEVSFDHGVITADGRQDTIAELELELLAGSPQTLFDLARDLQSRASLTLLFESKAQRGYRLAGHDGVAALKAQALAVGRETSGADAFQAIARETLVQIAGNARLLQRAHNPDVLHQMRVGLRRFRAALYVFKAMLDPEGLNLARKETKWIAGELSQARDIDVFLQNAATHDEIEADPGRTAFFRALRIAQADAYERVLAAVRSDRFRTWLFGAAEWIEIGGWRRLANDRQRLLREGVACALAAPVLDRLDRRVKRRSRGFHHLDVEARHDLRKQAKKLRYAAAFFSEAFTDHPKRRARFITALKEVQDLLGELNDAAVAKAVAMRAVGKRGGELAFAAGLEVARVTGDEHEQIKATRKAFKAFRKTEPFWSSCDDQDAGVSLPPPRLRSL